MNNESDAYHAYQLRVWRVPCQGRWQWRASLESPRTGERQVFARLQQLFDYLSERYDPQAGETEGRRNTGQG